MILRALLLIFIISCVLFEIYNKNTKIKYLFRFIVSILSIVLIYTFTTAHVTVKSVCNQKLITECIVDNFNCNNSPDSLKIDYTTEKNDSSVSSTFRYIKYSFDEKPTDKEVYDLIYSFYVERGYMCGLDITDKIIFKSLTPLVTFKKTESDVAFWFLPTVMEPYNPNSYLLKGCFYAEYFYNVFAWYQDGCLNVIYERCGSDIGKTDEHNFINFICSIGVNQGTVSVKT